MLKTHLVFVCFTGKKLSVFLLSHRCFSARYCLWDVSLKSDEGGRWVGGNQGMSGGGVWLCSISIWKTQTEVEGQVFCFSPRDQNIQQCNKNNKRTTDWDDTPVTDRV